MSLRLIFSRVTHHSGWGKKKVAFTPDAQSPSTALPSMSSQAGFGSGGVAMRGGSQRQIISLRGHKATSRKEVLAVGFWQGFHSSYSS